MPCHPAILQYCNREIQQSCNYPIANHKRPHSESHGSTSAHHRGPAFIFVAIATVITVTLHQNNVIIKIVFLEICLHHCCSFLCKWAQKKSEDGHKKMAYLRPLLVNYCIHFLLDFDGKNETNSIILYHKNTKVFFINLISLKSYLKLEYSKKKDEKTPSPACKAVPVKSHLKCGKHTHSGTPPPTHTRVWQSFCSYFGCWVWLQLLQKLCTFPNRRFCNNFITAPAATALSCNSTSNTSSACTSSWKSSLFPSHEAASSSLSLKQSTGKRR